MKPVTMEPRKDVPPVRSKPVTNVLQMETEEALARSSPLVEIVLDRHRMRSVIMENKKAAPIAKSMSPTATRALRTT